ncbi:MAG: diguanylate cyclase domain-containing protein [Solirubrobacteraceae bacterium]
MTEPTPRARRARPVWDARVTRLLDSTDELAKGWLLELLDQRPLARAESLPVGRLAAGGPRLCGAIVRALGGDAELKALMPDGELAPLLMELAAMVDADGPFEVSAALELLRGVLSSALRDCLERPEPELVWALGERLALVLEIARWTALIGVAPPAARDVRPATDDAIADARRRMSSLALLIVELEEPGRLLAALGGEHAATTFREFRQAVRTQVRPGDFLVEENDTRVWVLSIDSGSQAAREHAQRIADAVSRLAPWHGVPPAVAIGVAVLGEHAQTAESLIEAAEEARYAASAAGVPVGPPQ